MARPELEQLYQELIGSRFAFIPHGEQDLWDVYSAVRGRFASLCDDSYLCRQNCSQGHNQPEWQHVVRKVLDALKSPDGDISKGSRRRHWVFNDGDSLPEPSDLCVPPPARVLAKSYRVLRDTALTKRLKALHHDRCQICGLRIELPNGHMYSEAHHIQPLSDPHNGPDVAQNILVLCPNHHAMCDYGAIHLDLGQLRLHPSHQVGRRYIDYHNGAVAKWTVPEESLGPPLRLGFSKKIADGRPYG
jgi:hypothetical protein